MKGKVEPRIYTKPLRKLSEKTSLGYMFIEWCERYGQQLLPWQKWLSIHALEYVGSFPEDWHFRFRYVIVLISRQNGKTFWFKLLGLFFNYVMQTPLVIGTAQNLDLANDTFEEAVDVIEDNEELSSEFVKVLRAQGKREYQLKGGERWKVVATNRRGRGWSSDLILMDEIREQRDWEGWSAISKTMLARPKAILVGVSNAGDATSVVLRHLRMQAHAQCGDPDGIAEARGALGGEDIDDSIGIFEWSATPNCPIDDANEWAQANPSLGYGFLTESALRSAMMTDPENVFRTECLCQWVETLLPEPFPEGSWQAGIDPSSFISADSELWFGIDLSNDRRWLSIGVAGQREDGQWHVEAVKRSVGYEWAGEWFAERVGKYGIIHLAFQGRGAPVSGIAEKLCMIPGVERCAIEGPELSAGWGRFYDGIANSTPPEPGQPARGGTRIFHLPQPVIDLPARTMQLKTMGGGATLPDKAKSPDDPSPLFACVMAYAAATRIKPAEEKKVYESAYAQGAPLVFC